MSSDLKSRPGDPLTPRQQAVLDWIIDFTRRQGYPPSTRQIGAAFGISSPNGVVCHLKALIAKGKLRKDALRARGITVVGMGGDADYAEAVDLLETSWHEYYAALFQERRGAPSNCAPWSTALKIHRLLIEAGRLKEEPNGHAS